MFRTILIILGLVSGLAALIWALPSPSVPHPQVSRILALTDVRVFTEEGVSEPQTVLIQGGRIAALGVDIAIPQDAMRLDGTGLTAIPGLIDAHTHTWGAGLEETLKFGVTTHLDMFTAPVLLTQTRAARDGLDVDDQADLFSAGMMATVEGGHGTQYGIEIDTLSGPEQASDWVARRLAEGSDYIKLVYIPQAPNLPSLDLETATAIIRAARAEGVRVVAHVSSLAGAQDMVDAGVDGLVHIFADAEVNAAFIEAARRRDVFVIPTLSVIASVANTGSGARLAEDPRVSHHLSASALASLEGGFGMPPNSRYRYPVAADNVRRLHEAGITILAGSDAPNPGTAYGASLHQELGLLVEAGLSPHDALSAASHISADIFNLEDRGRIEPGARADLVLISGDILEDVAATLSIELIVRNGHVFDRSQSDASPSGAAQLVQNALTPFDDITNGFSWIESTDAMMGGSSQASLEVVDADLVTQVSVQPGFAFPWAGPSYFPASASTSALDLSEAPILVLEAKATPGIYRVMVFNSGTTGAPPTVNLTLGDSFETFRLDLRDISGFDHTQFAGLAIMAGPAPGEATITLRTASFEAAQ